MIRIALILALLCAPFAFAQDQQPQPEQKKPAPSLVSPLARLMAAKTAYLKNGGGSEIPFNVISNSIEGWPRFIVVDSPEQADVVIQVEAPEVDQNGVSVTSSSTDSDGHKISKSNHEMNISYIKLSVYDARTHLALWNSTERPKGGLKEKTRDDNIVQASEVLIQRLHQRLEPQVPAEAPAEKQK
jgi:hypothetical protein